MNLEYWYATSPEGRLVKYGYRELSDGVAAVSATAEGQTKIIVQRSVRAPLTREQVEALFEENFPAQDSSGEQSRSSKCFEN